MNCFYFWLWQIRLEVLHFSAFITADNDSSLCCIMLHRLGFHLIGAADCASINDARTQKWQAKLVLDHNFAENEDAFDPGTWYIHKPTYSLFSGHQGWFQASLSSGIDLLTSAEPESTRNEKVGLFKGRQSLEAGYPKTDSESTCLYSERKDVHNFTCNKYIY